MEEIAALLYARPASRSDVVAGGGLLLLVNPEKVLAPPLIGGPSRILRFEAFAQASSVPREANGCRGGRRSIGVRGVSCGCRVRKLGIAEEGHGRMSTQKVKSIDGFGHAGSGRPAWMTGLPGPPVRWLTSTVDVPSRGQRWGPKPAYRSERR